MFAEWVLSVNLPYSEYWLPLLIGAAVGLLAVTVFRFVSPASKVDASAAKEPAPDYDPFAQGSQTDQRSSFRRQGNVVQVHFAPPEHKSRPDVGWVINRSIGGICLAVSYEVPVGTILSLLPGNAPPMTPWVDVEVRSCRLGADGVELGCQFVKVPPWSVLLMFG